MFLFNITKNLGLWLFGHNPGDRHFLSYGSAEDNDNESLPENQSHDELEQLASEYMQNEQWKDQAKAYGIEYTEGSRIMPEDQPLQEIDDDYYTSSERESYERPRPALTNEQQEQVPCFAIRWQKGKNIGRGSFGSVAVALNLDSGDFLAIKEVVIPGDSTSSEVKALQQEINVLSSLQHTNIVRYLGSQVAGSTLNIFLEYAAGGSIAQIISEFGPIKDENLMRRYTKQILQGLDYLHRCRIIHRDIKGANILVDNVGVIKLSDFGASKKLEELASARHSFKGTVYWMAPEVINPVSGYGRQADIWSLGCTMLEMATGKPPWSNEYPEQAAALYAIATKTELPPIPEFLSDMCKDFVTLCFRRDPKARPNANRLLSHMWILSSPPPSPSLSTAPVAPNFPLDEALEYQMDTANISAAPPAPSSPGSFQQQYPYQRSPQALPPVPSYRVTSEESAYILPDEGPTHYYDTEVLNFPSRRNVPELRLPQEKFKRRPDVSTNPPPRNTSPPLSAQDLPRLSPTTTRRVSTSPRQSSSRPMSKSSSPIGTPRTITNTTTSSSSSSTPSVTPTSTPTLRPSTPTFGLPSSEFSFKKPSPLLRQRSADHVHIRQPSSHGRRSATLGSTTTAEFRRYLDLRALNIEEAPDIPGQTESQQ